MKKKLGVVPAVYPMPVLMVAAYDETGKVNVNPNSLVICNGFIEPSVAGAQAFDTYQFLRSGYFCVDCHDSREGAPVFNRIVSLKSSYKPA